MWGKETFLKMFYFPHNPILQKLPNGIFNAHTTLDGDKAFFEPLFVFFQFSSLKKGCGEKSFLSRKFSPRIIFLISYSILTIRTEISSTEP